ncbi:hypothetical protein ACLJJ6_08175 [Pediococcus siamensis]|uniref:hypothetical protein n=1 Tax=Pediococcus siamensis TaxID=381829 RepID=UPI0039A11448
MKRRFVLVILSIATMCLFNSPIRGDTHVSQSYVGFTKSTPKPNVSDRPIQDTIVTQPGKKQAYLPQTNERADITWQAIGVAGIGWIILWGVRKSKRTQQK